MAQPMPPIDDDNYVSSEDDDFLPDAPAAEAASESEESEDEAETSIPEAKAAAKPKPKPKKGQDEEAEEIGFENSGDEAIIGKGLKKARKRKRRGKDEEDDDEGGEGGFVKTRRMRAEMAEEEKRGPLATTAGATVDVDALFASMISQPFAKPTPVTATLPTTDGAPPESAAPVTQTSAAAASTLKSVPNPAQEDDTVTIHRTYTFAGKTHTETKVVPRSSAEARLYLESLPNGTPAPGASSSSPTQAKRTLKLARRSVFEPVPAVPLPVREDLKLGVGVIRERLTMPGKEDKGKKLNTVEKSKMDWAGYVDEEGLQEELEKAGKSKDSYLHRKDFLARGDQRKEEEARARRQREIAMAK